MSKTKKQELISEKDQIIAAKIKFFRKAAGMTQSELADEMSKHLNDSNVSRTLISKYEKGQAVPPLDKVIALSKALNVSPSSFLDVEDSGHEHVPELGLFMVYDSAAEVARTDLLRALFYYQQAYTCERVAPDYWLLHSVVEEPNNILLHSDEFEALIRTIETIFNAQFDSLKNRALRSDKYIKAIDDEEAERLRAAADEEGGNEEG